MLDNCPHGWTHSRPSPLINNQTIPSCGNVGSRWKENFGMNNKEIHINGRRLIDSLWRILRSGIEPHGPISHSVISYNLKHYLTEF